MTAITSNGRTFHGTFTRDIPTTFQISDGRLSCFGKFPPIIPGREGAHPYTLVMTCNHGVKGIVNFNDAGAAEGGGTLRLSDGTEGTFIYGEGAAEFLPGRPGRPSAY